MPSYAKEPRVTVSKKNCMCIDCNAGLYIGDPIWYNPEDKSVRCIECGTIKFEL